MNIQNQVVCDPNRENSTSRQELLLASASAAADLAVYAPADSSEQQTNNVDRTNEEGKSLRCIESIEGSIDDISIIEVDVDHREALSDDRDPSRIHFMPIDPTSEMEEGIEEELDASGHLIYERMLRDAWEFETDKRSLFELRSFDTEIEDMIDAGLEAALDAMDSKDATVSGIVVGVMKAMLSSHRLLAKYVTGPRRPEVRSVTEIQEELAGEYPRAVRRLVSELDEAMKRTAEAMRDLEGGARGGSPKSVRRLLPGEGVPLREWLPVDVFSRMTEEERTNVTFRPPFNNVDLVSLMNVAEQDTWQLDSWFSLHPSCDEGTRIALRAAITMFVNAMHSPSADACGLFAMAMKKFIASHSKLASDFNFAAEFSIA